MNIVKREREKNHPLIVINTRGVGENQTLSGDLFFSRFTVCSGTNGKILFCLPRESINLHILQPQQQRQQQGTRVTLYGDVTQF